MDKTLLMTYGIDYDKGLARCTNDADFYKTLLSMFLKDTSFERMKKAYDEGRWREMFGCAHELKGVSGTAALTGLYDAVCPLVELLREGDPDKAEAGRLFSAVEAAYKRTCEGIQTAF